VGLREVRGGVPRGLDLDCAHHCRDDLALGLVQLGRLLRCRWWLFGHVVQSGRTQRSLEVIVVSAVMMVPPALSG